MDSYIFEEFGKAFIPKNIRPGLGRYLSKAGFDNVPYKFFGALFIATAALTYFIYMPFIYPKIAGLPLYAMFFLTFLAWFGIQMLLVVATIAGIYFFLNIRIYKRIKEMEDALSEYLGLVSTNLRGGMSFEKSLWAAIRSEFGILSREMGIVSKKVATGNDVADALEELGRKYDSPILRRTMDILKGEVASGGRIAEVIDHLVDNLRKTSQLKQEMVATSLSYMIFMSVIVLGITPALFALSKQLLNIILGLGDKLGGAQASGSVISFTAPQISATDFQIFSMFAVGIIAVFTSMIISIIEKGDIKGGVKYIPLFLVVSMVVYLLIILALDAAMGGIVGNMG